MTFAQCCLLVQVASTWAMTGLIWFVQIVHYPLFDRVGVAGFARYERDHSQLTTLVVGPLMLAEAFTAMWLVARPPAGVPPLWTIVGAVLLGVVWAATCFLSVPQHRALAGGFDARAYQRLVSTAWVRTVAWSLRGLLVLAMLWRILSAHSLQSLQSKGSPVP